MKFKTISIIIAMISIFHNSFSQNDPHLIKILSYNIYHGQNPNSGDSNLDDIEKLILQIQPDLIALQEIDSMTLRSESLFEKKIDLIKELIERTGYEGFFGHSMYYNEGGYGVGLLVKKGSDFKTQSLPSPAGGEPRVAAWVISELESQNEIHFASTHFSNESSINRLAQLKALLAFADSLSLPTLFAGDLNFDPASDEYKSIPSQWKDAGLVADENVATYPGENGKRIDYVWYQSKKFEFVEYKVLDLPYSDHYPVLVTLKLKTKPDPQ